MADFWEYDAKYLGGHAAFAVEATGRFLLYPAPLNMVIFESERINMQIPVAAIKDSKILTEKERRARRVILGGLIAGPVGGLAGLVWKKGHILLIISFEDELGNIQNPVFEMDEIEHAANRLYDMRIKAKLKV